MAEAETPSHLGFRERWLTTILLGIGLILFAINASTTNLILPQIMTNLRVELYQVHWVTTAFGIARTVVIPALGWLSGRLGPRTLYLVSLGSFSLGTLGSALAWDWPSLIAFRILAGAGGGLMNPLSMAIFYQIFPPGQRGMALGFSLLGWSIGPSIGPLAGGYLMQFSSWRVVYSMLLPFCGLGFLLAWWLLPPLNRPERRRLDFLGLVSMACAVVPLLLALTRGRREGWDSPAVLTMLIIAGVFTIVFIVIELRHAQPLVELRLLRYMPFVMAVLVMFLSTVAFRSTGPMKPVFMQRVLGFEPLLVAWVMLPSNILYGVAVMMAGRLADKLSPEGLVMAGLGLYAAVFVAYAGINELATAAMMATFIAIRQLAQGVIGAPNNLTALRALPEDQVMMAAGLLGVLRSIAAALGTSMAGVFWDGRFARHLNHYAENAPGDGLGVMAAFETVHQSLVWAGEIAATIPVKTTALIQRQWVAHASTAAWQDYFWANAVLALLSLIPAFLVKRSLWQRVRPRTEETPNVESEKAAAET